MSIWKTSSIEQTPTVVLSRWQVYEVTTPYMDHATRHFVGYNETEREGRVSSNIQEFDVVAMRGLTRSGRVYQLSGPSGTHPDASYVWEHWKHINEVDTCRNITEEFEDA